MVLLTEQERLIAYEQDLINDTTGVQITAVADWTTEKTYNITLAQALIVYLKVQWYMGNSGGGVSCSGAGRILIDGYPFYGTGGQYWSGINGGSMNIPSPDLYVLLAAGSHTITIQVAAWKLTSSGYIGVNSVFIAQLLFNDVLSAGPWDSGSIQIAPEGSWVTLLNQNVTIPAGRTLPVGNIANYSAFLYLIVKDVSASPSRRVHLKSTPEGPDGSKISIRLYINGTYVAWTTRTNDDADGDTSDNATYGCGASGSYIAPVAVNQTLNIQVQGYMNNATPNVEVWGTMFLCPWLTPMQDYQPATFSFAQDSTFYAILEPLAENASIWSKIGKKRFISFGNATDYYSIASAGSGIVEHTYIFDVVDVPSSQWIVSCTGYIVCISYVGVDAR
jgi:hypothetical protein